MSLPFPSFLSPYTGEGVDENRYYYNIRERKDDLQKKKKKEKSEEYICIYVRASA